MLIFKVTHNEVTHVIAVIGKGKLEEKSILAVQSHVLYKCLFVPIPSNQIRTPVSQIHRCYMFSINQLNNTERENSTPFSASLHICTITHFLCMQDFTG
jgi:hypothetical protein